MFLACVELAGDDRGNPAPSRRPYANRVAQLRFPHLETARVWAEEESSRRADATGNAAVFQTLGPFVSLVWERDATDLSDAMERTAERFAQSL